jgi:UDP-N-acetylglucosamine 2-epimerase (non-hydrolysing)
MKIILVCGARPNFMKIAPLLRAINKHNELIKANDQSLITPILVHTGQHYDYEMSQVFFQDLELPKPDVYLGVGSGTHAEQTGKVMIEFEKVLLKEKPDLVVVVGDVNSTLAAALAAVKLDIPVAHVEAGLRSYDRTMPEEINRLLTDQISDYLFTHSRDADENLKREGIPVEKIFFVGNVMVDSLLFNKARADQSQILAQLKLTKGGYALVTLHRPSNVDEKHSLKNIMSAMVRISEQIPVVFPAHPRTQKKLREFNLDNDVTVIGRSPDGIGKTKQSRSESQSQSRILITAPLSYLDFLKLEMYAKFVMTDSGGIQEETTVLNVPCLTLRDTTERPITITQGTNVIVGNNPRKIIQEACKILGSKPKPPSHIEFWDGMAAERIIAILAKAV